MSSVCNAGASKQHFYLILYVYKRHGFKAVKVRSPYTDILFIPLHYANCLQGISILFQAGKSAKRRCINVSGLPECPF